MATRTTAITRTAILLGALGLGLGACSKGSPNPTPPSIALPSTSASVGASPATSATPSSGPSESPSGGSGGSGGTGGNGGATTDDLKVFAYATTDEKTVLADVDDVANVVAKAESDARAHDPNALKSDASDLATVAGTLSRDARTGSSRQDPLDPADATLVKARRQAIDAFSLAANYAELAQNLAQLAANPSVQTFQAVLQMAGQLQGDNSQVVAAFDELNLSLQKWSSANPAAAARALALYGG